jgi:hypothetical protein
VCLCLSLEGTVSFTAFSQALRFSCWSWRMLTGNCGNDSDNQLLRSEAQPQAFRISTAFGRSLKANEQWNSIWRSCKPDMEAESWHCPMHKHYAMKKFRGCGKALHILNFGNRYRWTVSFTHYLSTQSSINQRANRQLTRAFIAPAWKSFRSSIWLISLCCTKFLVNMPHVTSVQKQSTHSLFSFVVVILTFPRISRLNV